MIASCVYIRIDTKETTMFGNVLLLRLVVDEIVFDFQIPLEKSVALTDPEVTEKVQDMRYRWNATAFRCKLVQGKV